MSDTLRKVEQILREAEQKRSWGSVEIDLKDGRVYLIRQTVQIKPEDSPVYARKYQRRPLQRPPQ
jgi:hypothetical protein